MALQAPRILKAPIGWRLSAFRRTGGGPAENAMSGVRRATPRSRCAAARMSSSPTRASGVSLTGVAGARRGRRSPRPPGAVDAGGGPGDGFEALGPDRPATAPARPEGAGNQPLERVLDLAQLGSLAIAGGGVALLLEDMRRSGGLRAVG